MTVNTLKSKGRLGVHLYLWPFGNGCYETVVWFIYRRDICLWVYISGTLLVISTQDTECFKESSCAEIRFREKSFSVYKPRNVSRQYRMSHVCYLKKLTSRSSLMTLPKKSFTVLPKWKRSQLTISVTNLLVTSRNLFSGERNPQHMNYNIGDL